MGDLFDIFCLFVVSSLKVLFLFSVFALCCVNAACTLWQRREVGKSVEIAEKGGRGKGK